MSDEQTKVNKNNIVTNPHTLFGGKIATEVEQAYVRIVMFVLASSYFVWADSYFIEGNDPVIVWVYVISAFSVSLITLFLVKRYTGYRPFSRKFHLVFDIFMAFVAFLILGKYAYPIFFTYLFVAIGYGMRYSLYYLVAGMVLSVVTHAFAIFLSSYDPAWYQIASDYALLIILPAYAGTLIKRLNESYRLTEAAFKETATALEKAESASRAKTMFLANISHDLRTPLVGVGTASELLDTKGWDDNNKELLKTISASSDVLEQQINLILEYAKSESGEIVPDIGPVSLPSLLQDCETILSPQASKKGIKLSFNYETQHCIESYDPGLRKIIMNIAGNAIKFTESGQVSVDVVHKDDQLHIDVVDTGIGIPENKLDDIFNPFTQVDGSITRKYGGSGLGTAIAKQIVDELGGNIHIESKEGKGTHVSINLPARILEPSSCAIYPYYDQEIEECDKTSAILVADDNNTNRHIIELVLKKGGYTNYDLVTDGASALQALNSKIYDLAILDRHMPEMDGGAVLENYKANKDKKPIRSIFLTADQTDGALEEFRNVGFDAFITKPFKPDVLLDKINQLLIQ